MAHSLALEKTMCLYVTMCQLLDILPDMARYLSEAIRQSLLLSPVDAIFPCKQHFQNQLA